MPNNDIPGEGGWSEPPRWLRLLTFGAACMTAGILLGGAIAIKAISDRAEPVAAPAVVRYVPIQAPCRRPPAPRWREHDGRYDT